jgi:hypothetical protein
MTGSYERLVAHVRNQDHKLFCAALPVAQWQEVRLALELARADYAALPVQGEGWAVLTPHPLTGCALDVTACWEDVLQGYAAAEGTGPIALSEGWAAAAHARPPASPAVVIPSPAKGACEIAEGLG